MIALNINQYAFQTLESVTLDSNSLAERKIGPRLNSETRRNDCLNGCNLAVINRKRDPTSADHRDHSWRNQDGQASLSVKLTEYVTREQGGIHFPWAPIPSFLRLVGRKKRLIALSC